MSRTEIFTIEQTRTHERLDIFLRDRYPIVSRGTIQRLIEEGHIRVNGQRVKFTHTPRAGELVRIHWPDARPSSVQPIDLPLDVIYEDADLLVVNKPPGLVVHPASGTETDTLVSALLHHCRGQLSGIGGVQRPGIVHRLDKETSGCIVVAKNDSAHRQLSNQFKARTIEKVYLAIVHGPLPHADGQIKAAIARHPSHRKCMAVTSGTRTGRDAWTSYHTLEKLQHATLVEVQLHTGRTHQIRVHFKHIGHPLVGDLVYGKRQVLRLQEETGVRPARFMLHSHRLGFSHPTTGKPLLCEAPIPEDFKQTLSVLQPAAGEEHSGAKRR